MPRGRDGRDDRVLKELDINIRGETASTIKRRLSGEPGIDRGYEMPRNSRGSRRAS
jgi:hypothetical protein